MTWTRQSAATKAFFAKRLAVAVRMYRHGFTFRQIGAAIDVDATVLIRQFAAAGVEVRRGSEAVKTQWVNAPARRRAASAKMSQMATGNTWKLGTKDPAQAERMRVKNPMRIPEVRERARRNAIGKQAGSKNPMYGKPAPNGGKSGYKQGRRPDLGPTYFRSTWEANLARVYNATGVRWQFEPKAFPLSGGRTYRPDFYLSDSDTWVEVKGMWRPDAKAKFDDLLAEYPDLRLMLIDEPAYNAIREEWRPKIGAWE